MRLLVSVRTAAEASAAVAGGAHIVDAKEPERGSLGAVDPAAAQAIADGVPADMPLSFALGDLQDPGAVRNALGPLERIGRRPPELYIKIGLAGCPDPAQVRAIVGAMVQVAGALPLRPTVVAVGYADHSLAGTLPPDMLAHVAADAGAQGLLLDTWSKTGRDVFSWMGTPEMQRWVEHSKRLGLLTAVAGSLSVAGVRSAARLGPDLVGVRGAACDGGRSGQVSAVRVRRLALAMAQGGASLAVAITSSSTDT